MSSTGRIPDVDSFRSQISELLRELGERDHTVQAQTQRLAETLQDLQEQSDLLRTIIEGTAGDTGDEFFASLVTHLTSALQVQYAIIGEVIGDRDQTIRTLAVSAGGTLIDNFEYALEHAPCGTGLAHSFWCFEQGVRAQFPQFPNLATLGVESHCGVSLRTKTGAVIGLLIIMDTKPLCNTQRLQSLMEVFASRATAELQRHRAEAAARKSEATRRESEEWFQAFLDHAPNLAFVKGTDGRYLYTNRRFDDVFGIPPHSALGKTDIELFGPEKAADFCAHDQEVLRLGTALEFEEVAWHADGAHTSIVIKFPFRDPSGQIHAVGGIATDITDRKRAEKALSEQERHLVTAQALAHLGSWDWNIETGNVLWSDEQYRIFGHEPRAIAITYDTFLASLHPDDHDRVLAAVNDALLGHRSFDHEYRIVRPNGEVRLIHGRAEVHRDATGHPLRMDGTVLDITAQKQVEEAFRTSEERWHLAVRGSNDGIWDWDVQTGVVFFSARWKSMRGYEEHEISDSLDEWRSRIHPDDMDRVLSAADTYLARQRPDFCEEYRVQRKNGSYMWILDRGAAIWDAQGTALRMAGSETDITERKQAEDALRESEARTRSIIETALDAVITIDRNSRIVGWNSQATAIFGYAAQEAIGRNLSETIIPAQFRQAHAAGLARVFQSGAGAPVKRRMELPALHRDGHEFPVEFAIAMTYIGGQPVFSAFVRDITEQKQAAEALTQRERQLRTVLEALPVGVWFTDANGRVLLSNPAARQLWAGARHIGIGAGVESDESNWWEMIGPAADPHRWMLSDVLTKGEPATDDTLEIVCEDGTRKIVRNSAVPVRAEDGSIQGAILLNEDITERVRAEHERARTQAFLESIIENIPHMITVKDTQHLRFVTVNRAAEQFFKRSRTELIGSSVFDILDEETANVIFASDLQVLERNEPMEISDHVVHRPSQGARVLRTKKLPIFASQGRPQHLLSISEDVTERTQAEALEQQRVAQLLRFQAAQLRLSKLTHAALEADFRTITEATADALDVERLSVWLFNDSHPSMVCRDLYTRTDQRHQSGPVLEALHHPQYFAALESALIVAAHDAQDDPRTHEFATYLKERGITSRLDVPVRQEGKLVGLLSHEHVGSQREWSSEEEAFAISIADHLALCLAAAERRRVEAALRQSEERFAKAFRSSPHPVVIADAESGLIIEANDAACGLFEYQREDVGQTTLEIGLWPSSADRTRFIQLLRRHGSVRNFEVSLRTKTGQLRHCLLSSEIIDLNGRRCMVTVGNDVTEQKRAEEALRDSEARFRTMAEAIPHQVWTATPDGNLDYVNQRCLEYFITTSESLTGSYWQNMIHPDDLALCLERWSNACAAGQPYQVEFRLLRASDQTFRWHIARALPLLNSEGGIIKWVGTNTDVTDLKQAEQALKQGEQDLRHAMEERERISQDLHDGILQSLYAVGLGLESCKPLMSQQKHDQALGTMETAIGQLNRIMAEVRNFIAGLESEALQGGTFETAVRTVINTVTQCYPLDCRVHIEREALRYIPMDRGLQLLNILREALSNSVRHAQASRLSVSIRRLRRTIRLRIHDNGIGFDAETVTGTGHGLLNMAARAKKIRTEFQLHSAPREGTTIILDLPKEEA